MKKTMLSLVCAMATFTGVASAQVSLGAQAGAAAHVDTKPVVQGVQRTSQDVTKTTQRTVDGSTRAVDRSTRSASRQADSASRKHVDASAQTSERVDARHTREGARVSAGTSADLDASGAARHATGSAGNAEHATTGTVRNLDQRAVETTNNAVGNTTNHARTSVDASGSAATNVKADDRGH